MQHAARMTIRIRLALAAAKTSLQQWIFKASMSSILGLPAACLSSTSAKSSMISTNTGMLTHPPFLLQRWKFEGSVELTVAAEDFEKIFSATTRTCGSLGCKDVSLHTIATCVIAFRLCFLLVFLAGEPARSEARGFFCRMPGRGTK